MLFRHPFQNLFFLVVCVVVVVAAYLRVEQISEIYDEYDDVGVIALQKAPLQELELDLDIGPIKRIRFDATYLQNIETSIWYGAFMGHVWTYAPGQYILASLFLTGDLTARQRHIAVRGISAAISIATILLLFTFMTRVSSSKNGQNWIAPSNNGAFGFLDEHHSLRHAFKPLQFLWICLVSSSDCWR